jgi:hypothetical protein
VGFNNLSSAGGAGSGSAEVQPYTGGTAIGSGNGSGTAIVGGSSSAYGFTPLGPKGIIGDAAFKSTGNGVGFARLATLMAVPLAAHLVQPLEPHKKLILQGESLET